MTSSIQKIVVLSEKLLQKEIKHTGFPILENHKVGLLYGRKLARPYGVNEGFIDLLQQKLEEKMRIISFPEPKPKAKNYYQLLSQLVIKNKR